AAQARSLRRVKLAAARARLAALAAAGTGVFSSGAAGGAGFSEKDVRKQQRMLRNRESAALSRKRKSDRIGELELQVEALQEENRRLRQRVDESGNESCRGVVSASSPMAPAKVQAQAPPSAAATCAAPPRATWAPTNLAADAALSATSIIVPSASATNIVPATPPAPGDASDIFHFRPDASMTASGCPATSCSTSSSAANACFNFISRPAVFA
ncbi:unnamed protein product, partial [Hapterophycus canaliculatus]